MAMKRDYDYLFKIVLVGDSGVGKSSIISRFVDDTFHENTILNSGIDFRFRTTNIDMKTIKLQMWDMSSPIEEIIAPYYRDGHIYTLVYSRGDALDKICEYATKIEEEWKDNTSRTLLILLLENKSDINSQSSIQTRAFFRDYQTMIERQYDMNIPFELMEICELYHGVISWGKRLAMEKGWLFYRVSAKTGYNIEKAFVHITSFAIKEREERSMRTQPAPKPNTHCCIL